MAFRTSETYITRQWHTLAYTHTEMTCHSLGENQFVADRILLGCERIARIESRRAHFCTNSKKSAFTWCCVLHRCAQCARVVEIVMLDDDSVPCYQRQAGNVLFGALFGV